MKSIALKKFIYKFFTLFLIVNAIVILVQSFVLKIPAKRNIFLEIDLFFILLLFILKDNAIFFIRNFIDLLGLFFPFSKKAEKSSYKKKILIFNWRDIGHAYAGGAEVYVHEISKRWVKQGYKVTLFCGNDSKSKRYEKIEEVEIIRRGGFYLVYVWAFLYYVLRFKGKYDLILDCQNGIPFFTPLYASEPIYCLMFHVHEDVFRISLIKPLATIASFLEKKVMPRVYREIKFITISESSKKEMQKLGLGKAGIEVVHPGVDTKKLFPVKRKSKNPLILYIGRLKYYKSLHIFIRIAAKILKKVPNADFIIAGNGEEKNALRRLVKNLGIKNKIKFLGRVSEKKKIELYQKAWVFLNPSLVEGWGLTTIEANACATPVVASDVSGLKDSVRNPHTGFLVDYGNVDKFAKKTILLIKNRILFKKMSKGAVKWARKFDWKKSADKGIGILDSRTQY